MSQTCGNNSCTSLVLPAAAPLPTILVLMGSWNDYTDSLKQLSKHNLIPLGGHMPRLSFCWGYEQYSLQNEISSSALAQHGLDTGHSIDWDNSKVLSTQQHWYQRCCLESWHIWAHTLNQDFGSLSATNNCLLPNHQTSHSTR